MRRVVGSLLLAASVACLAKPFVAPSTEVIAGKLLTYSPFHTKSVVWFLFAAVLLVVGLIIRAGGKKPNAIETEASDAPLYPVLRELVWSMRNPSSGRRLVRVNSENNVWVSFVVTAPGGTIVESEGQPEVLERAALKNLARLPLRWEVIAQHPDGRPRSLVCRHEYAAEGLLSSELMTAAHAMLGADHLLAAVPIRGALMVIDAAAAQEAFALYEYAQSLFTAAEHERVCATPLLVEGGRVVGIAGPLTVTMPREQMAQA